MAENVAIGRRPPLWKRTAIKMIAAIRLMTATTGPQDAAERRPGDASPARYVGAALLNGAVSVSFLLLAAHDRQPHQRILTRANVLTLSRAGSAGLLAGTTAAPRVGRRIAWMALLWGGCSDWLDGRFARLDGATPLGALLDIEADSWLSLWAAAAAYRAGDLPPVSLLPPVIRYVIPVLLARSRCARPAERGWQRAAAGLQATAVALTLAPLSRLHRVGRMMAPVGATAQMASIAVTIRNTLRAARAAVVSSTEEAPIGEDRRAARDRASA